MSLTSAIRLRRGATSRAGSFGTNQPRWPDRTTCRGNGHPAPRPRDRWDLEVLLLRRSENARFMPNVWVFPGGALDREDGDGIEGLKTCAIRELHEEAGVRLDPSTHLVPLARWVTPEVIKTRFDTWFFLAKSPAGIEITPDGSEMTA